MNKKQTLWILAGTGAVVYLFFRYLFFCLLPIFLSVAIAKLLYPLVFRLKRRMGASNFFCVFLPVLLFYGGSGCLLYLIGSKLLEQTLELFRRFPVYQDRLLLKTQRICDWCDRTFSMESGASHSYVMEGFQRWCESASASLGNLSAGVWNCVKYTASIVGAVGVVLFLTCMLLLEYQTIRRQYHNCALYEDIQRIITPITKVALAYMRAQAIIISLVALVCVAGFYFVGSHYAVLFGILVAVMDAFPILGSGIVFVPLIFYELLQGQIGNGLIYLVSFLSAQLIRQFLEPRLIGNKMGVSPFYVMIFVYLGLQWFGVAGVVLGPMALVLWRSLFSWCKQEWGRRDARLPQ